MKTLRYGNPPDISDCVDLGTVPLEVSPKKIENNGIFAGDMIVHELSGMEIPSHRRAMLTVSYYRDKDVPKPYRVNIPGLGTLVYADRDAETGLAGDNWEILED